MATISPESLYSNIDQSLDAYFAAHVAGTLSVPVQYQRAPRFATLPDRWVEPVYIPLSQTTDLMVIGNRYATLAQYLVNANCYELDDRRIDGSGDATAYTLTLLVDAVLALFAYGIGIPIYDYAMAGTPQVGALTVLEKARVIPRARTETEPVGVTMVTISATLTYYDEAG